MLRVPQHVSHPLVLAPEQLQCLSRDCVRLLLLRFQDPRVQLAQVPYDLVEVRAASWESRRSLGGQRRDCLQTLAFQEKRKGLRRDGGQLGEGHGREGVDSNGCAVAKRHTPQQMWLAK